MLKQLFREPLVHFLVLGAALFALDYLVSDPAERANPNLIEISRGDIQRLAAAWERQWRRAPTAEEMQGLVAELVREEVLYREALALGLDRDDTLIRRRLAQKMEFLTEDLADQIKPNDEQLAAFFAERREAFAEPARLSFSHVYFSRDRRGSATDADARLVRAELEAAGITDATGRGDPFMLQSEYREIDAQDLAQLFGDTFARDVFTLPLDEWRGPLQSSYGLHLVRVTAREDMRLPELAEVRDRVEMEYAYEQRRQVNAETFERLRSRYEIRIEESEAIAAGGDTAT
jgi:hypothetical protein